MARVLLVVRASKGGEFVNVTSLASELVRRGQPVAISGPHEQHRGEVGADVLPLPMIREVSPARDSLAVLELARTIRRWRPDLVHAHGSKGGAVARLARLASPRTPLVYTPHQYAFANYFAAREARVYRAMERALAPLASRVICVCEAERRLAAEIGPAGRTRLVYNGIEPPQGSGVHPEVERLSRGGPLICAVSELHVRKGVATLIEAMPAILRAHPRASLVVAGDGPEREHVKARIAALGVTESVHMLGHVDDVESVLRGAGVFVNPAWAESFPYAILEAMAFELPIVATDVGGVGEAIVDGASGLVVPPRDCAALADAVDRMLSDRKRASALGAAAGARQRELFSAQRMVDETLAVYEELVEV